MIWRFAAKKLARTPARASEERRESRRLHRDHSRRISSVVSIWSLLVRRTHESEIPDEEEASR
jgi:hypothetical protein